MSIVDLIGATRSGEPPLLMMCGGDCYRALYLPWTTYTADALARMVTGEGWTLHKHGAGVVPICPGHSEQNIKVAPVPHDGWRCRCAADHCHRAIYLRHGPAYTPEKLGMALAAQGWGLNMARVNTGLFVGDRVLAHVPMCPLHKVGGTMEGARLATVH